MIKKPIKIGLIGDVDGMKEIVMNLSEEEFKFLQKIQKEFNNTSGYLGQCWIHFSLIDINEEKRKQEAKMKKCAEEARKKAEEARKEKERRIKKAATAYSDEANPIRIAYMKALAAKKGE